MDFLSLITLIKVALGINQYIYHDQWKNGFILKSFENTDRNNLVTLGIQVTQFLDLLFESTLVLVLSTENKTELTNW